MYQQKKQRDYKSLWIASVVMIAIGIILTITPVVIRPLGYALLGVGLIFLIMSLNNLDKWKDKQDKDKQKHFN